MKEQKYTKTEVNLQKHVPAVQEIRKVGHFYMICLQFRGGAINKLFIPVVT